MNALHSKLYPFWKITTFMKKMIVSRIFVNGGVLLLIEADSIGQGNIKSVLLVAYARVKMWQRKGKDAYKCPEKETR